MQKGPEWAHELRGSLNAQANAIQRLEARLNAHLDAMQTLEHRHDARLDAIEARFSNDSVESTVTPDQRVCAAHACRLVSMLHSFLFAENWFSRSNQPDRGCPDCASREAGHATVLSSSQQREAQRILKQSGVCIHVCVSEHVELCVA